MPLLHIIHTSKMWQVLKTSCSVLFCILLQSREDTSIFQPGFCKAVVIRSAIFLLRWPNTVFARTFADVIQRVHKDCKNKHVVNRAIILFIQNPHYLRYFSILLNAVY